MARIRHIALTTENPSKTAAFYKEAVFLTDGHINLAVLNLKDNRSADVGAHGENFTGIHHFGFEVENLDDAVQQLEIANAEQLTGADHVDKTMAAGGHANFEMKWSGPDGVVIDISHTGWEGY
jgi:catechol 2,3-dioxygenase-like lactoylglutathione lyase family enzyme